MRIEPEDEHTTAIRADHTAAQQKLTSDIRAKLSDMDNCSFPFRLNFDEMPLALCQEVVDYWRDIGYKITFRFDHRFMWFDMRSVMHITKIDPRRFESFADVDFSPHSVDIDPNRSYFGRLSPEDKAAIGKDPVFFDVFRYSCFLIE